MPDFKLWPATAVLTAQQIAQLKIPAPGKGWQTVRVPDDYVVRGEFSPEPNAGLLVGGAVCPLGGRECEVPNGAPETGRKGALNRPGRDAYGGHGYLPVYPAWYQRTLSLPASAKGKSVWLDFGGVYRDAVVFVNGKFRRSACQRLYRISPEYHFRRPLRSSPTPSRCSSIRAGLKAGGTKEAASTGTFR